MNNSFRKILFAILVLVVAFPLTAPLVFAATLITQVNPGVDSAGLGYAVENDYTFFAVFGNGNTSIFYHDSDGTNKTFTLAGNTGGKAVSAVRDSINNKYYIYGRGCDSSDDNSFAYLVDFDIATSSFGTTWFSQSDGRINQCGIDNTKGIIPYTNQNRIDFLLTSQSGADNTAISQYKRYYIGNNTQLCTYNENPSVNTTINAIYFNSTNILRINSVGPKLEFLTISNSSTCTYPSGWSNNNLNTIYNTGTIPTRRLYTTLPNPTLYNYNILFSTNKDGNYELYATNATQSTAVTRLTTTGQDEILLDIYQNQYGTVHLLYTTSTGGTGQLYIDSFCGYDPVITLGSVCAGESGGGGGGTTTPAINYQLVVTDKSRCDALSVGCWANDLSLFSTTQDWVEASYNVNNTPITNGTCVAFDIVTSTPYDLTYNNSNNPFGTVNVYSADLHAALYHDLAIRCTDGTTPIIASFFTQGTQFPLQTFDLKAGKQTHFNDRVSVYEAPAIARAIVTNLNKFNYGNVLPEIICSYIDSDLTNYGSSSGSYTPVTVETTGDSIKSTVMMTGDPLLISAQTYSAGYHKYEASCYGNNIGSGLNPRAAVSSVSEARSLNVVDACNGNYLTSKLINTAIPVSGYYNNTFFFGQYPNYHFEYQYLVNGTSGNWQSAACRGSWSLAYTNGTVISQNTIVGGVVPDFRLALGGNDSDVYLPVGSYQFDVQCSNTDINLCINNAEFNKTITIDAAAGTGTIDNCGTTSAQVCSPAPFTCESGVNVTLPPACIDQTCYSQDVASSDNSIYGFPPGCITYSAQSQIQTPGNVYTDLACVPNTDLKWAIRIYNRGQLIDPASINAFCNFRIKTGILQSAFTTTVYSGNGVLDSPNRQYIATLPNYANYLGCGQDWLFEGQCYASVFQTRKIGTEIFTIAPNAFCQYNQYSIPAGACVDVISNDPLDKPQQCTSDLHIVNNTVACGCPPGMSVNSTGDGCSGTAQTVYNSNQIRGFLFWWTNLVVNNLVIVLALLILGMFYSIYRRSG